MPDDSDRVRAEQRARLFNEAMQAHRRGNLDGAERLYRRLLEANPQDADALNLLGTINRQRGQFAEAVEGISKAISLRPSAAYYHLNLGEACRALGRLHEAAEAYETVLRLRPRDLHAHRALAASHAGIGQVGQAIEVLRRAIAIDHTFAPAYEDLAGFLAQTGDFAGAIDACNTAISLFPRRATSHYKLGAVLTKKRDPIGAVNAYKRAIELRPDWPQPWAGLAQAHVFSGSHALAENAARRALSLDPNLASAHNHLGLALAWQGLPTQAVQAYLRSIEIDSSRVETRANLASARLQSLEQAEAISLYRQTLLMRPDDLELASNLLFARNYVHIGNELELFEEHKTWGARLAERRACDARSRDVGRTPGAPLRVGYVSPDLCDHPVARFIEPILAGHRRRVIEPVVYNDALRADEATRHLKGLVSEWHDVAQMSNSELAERIRRDRIDILIDLAGHTAGNRLRMFALKPAPVPVQITYLGYPNTTGLPSNIMNYRLTDSLCDPPGETDAFHTEKLVRLPAPFLCYQPPADAPDPRDAPALRNGYITFGCFNAMAKITRWVIERWSEILRRVDDSKILLKNRSLADQVLRERVRAEFDRHGISQDRVLLSGHEPTEHAHLSRYHEVDIALDTFPYHGTTTTCEALWIGVPVITLVGQAHRSRVGLTLLSAVGLEEFAPTTPKDYIDRAVALAREPERLATSRRALRSAMQASALLDRSKFIWGLEAALLACSNK